MTKQLTSQDVPQEILLQIFKSLSKKALRQCELVCKSWYLASHLLILNDVVLPDSKAIQHFLQSIKADPNPLFLNAVRTITVGKNKGKGKPTGLSRDDVKQLICQFPYLKEFNIKYITFPLEFLNDEEVCDSISKNCPELEHISISEALMQNQKTVQCYQDIAYKLRPQWTRMVIRTFRKRTSQTEDQMVQFLSSFPRLQEIEICSFFGANSLERLLVLFEQLPCLKKFKCNTESDETDFVEKYLRANENVERELLLDKLAKLETFSIYNNYLGHFCLNTVQFITQYLTGLRDLEFTCFQIYRFDDLRKNIFCSNLLDYASKLPSYDITVENTPKNTVLDCLRAATQRVYHPVPQGVKHVERNVQIDISHADTSFKINLQSKNIDEHRISRLTKIWCPNPRRFNGLFDRIVEAMVPANDIYTLELKISETAYVDNRFPPRFFSALDALMKGLPSLTKLVLTMPSLHHNQNYIPPTARYPNIEHLEANIIFNTNKTETVQDTISMFSGVKYLKLHYYCGNFRRYDALFDLHLKEHELEQLDLDLTLVLNNIQILREIQEDNVVSSFFLLEISLLGEKKERFFKVSIPQLKISEINESDVDHITSERVCMQVKILVKDLKLLNIYILQKDHLDIIKTRLRL